MTLEQDKSTSGVPRTAASHARPPCCANEDAARYIPWQRPSPVLQLPKQSWEDAWRCRHVDASELCDRHSRHSLICILPSPTEHDAMSLVRQIYYGACSCK